jgi:O-antigen ligase
MRRVAFRLSLVLIFVIPWENVAEIAGIGALAKATGLLVTAFWVLVVAGVGGIRKPHPFHFLALSFMLWNALSVVWSVDVDRTIERSLTYLQMFGLIYIIWDLYTTPAALRAGLQAYVLGCCVSIVSLFANYAHGVGAHSRYTATGFNTNQVALIFALGMPVAWYLVLTGARRRTVPLLRWVNYAYIPTAFYAILLTGSRSGLLATLPFVVFALRSLARFRVPIRVLLVSMSTAGLLALLAVAPEASLRRLTRMADNPGGFSRLDIWREGLTVFSQHPFFGVGSSAFATAASEIGKPAHNFAVSLLVEVGIIGFGLWLAVVGMTVSHAMRLPRPNSAFWLTILVAWLISASTHDLVHLKLTWLFWGLVIVDSELSAWDAQEPVDPRG